jgi:hypothetical protein
MNPSLIQLSHFVPDNDAEKAVYNIDAEKYIIQNYIDDSNSSWSSGKYYLGGQIKLDPNEPITPELFKKAWKPYLDGSCDDYCNSFEYASIMRAKAGLTSITKIVEKYIEVQKLRIMNELEKTKLVTDVNKSIVSFI